MIILFKYCADVEKNYKRFRGFGFIYILVSCSCDVQIILWFYVKKKSWIMLYINYKEKVN